MYVVDALVMVWVVIRYDILRRVLVQVVGVFGICWYRLLV
jgi:hypothetical protein